MEMYPTFKIEKIIAKVKLAPKPTDALLAFGELWFYMENQELPLFKVKGFRIRITESKNTVKKFHSVSFPAYPSKFSKTGYLTSFFIDDKEGFYKDICRLFLQEFAQLTGDITPEDGVAFEKEEITDEEMDKIAEEIDKQSKE